VNLEEELDRIKMEAIRALSEDEIAEQQLKALESMRALTPKEIAERQTCMFTRKIWR